MITKSPLFGIQAGWISLKEFTCIYWNHESCHHHLSTSNSMISDMLRCDIPTLHYSQLEHQQVAVVSKPLAELQNCTKKSSLELRKYKWFMVNLGLLTINADFDTFGYTRRYAIGCNAQISGHIQTRNSCHFQYFTFPFGYYKSRV